MNFKLLRHELFSMVIGLACACVFVSAGLAQTDLAAAHEIKEKRRNAVMEFVHHNHPEMEALLLVLEQSKPARFDTAINRIGKTLSRMKVLKKKHPEKYLASIERWKVKSEIEIQTARLANSNDEISEEELRTQLNALIESFVDIRQRILELERRHLQKKLARTERVLDSIENDRETIVKRNLRSVEKTIKQLKSGKPVKN